VPFVLSLACAITYGIADYCGGRASRRWASTLVTLVGQAVSLVLIVATVLVIGTASPAGADLRWGACGGAAGAVALTVFYYCLANGEVSVVAPATAVVSAGLPVSLGVLGGASLTVTAVIGIVIAVVAIALISGIADRARRAMRTSSGILALAVLAGVGFGLTFYCFDRTSEASGLWPLVAARAVSVPIIATVVLVRRPVRVPGRDIWLLVAASGVLDMLANLFFLLSTRDGELALTAVVASMYPASTIVLAFWLDAERLSRWQGAGLALAAVALVLINLPG
jgi:drug/metabolite transporter (DMT)-like permease